MNTLSRTENPEAQGRTYRSLFADAVAAFLLLASSGLCADVRTHAKPARPLLQPAPAAPSVSGSIVTSVPQSTQSRRASAARDIALPGVEVVLNGAGDEARGGSVKTDSRGRFFFRAVKPGTYRLCWQAPGFKDGCRETPVTIAERPQSVGMLRIAPVESAGTAVVFGNLRLADGSRPLVETTACWAAPPSVGVLDTHGKPIGQALANAQGEFVLTRVPLHAGVLLRARLESGSSELRLAPGSEATASQVELTLANRPPRLEPLRVMGRGGAHARTAALGEKLALEAAGSDPDGDKLRYRWILSDGAGSLAEATQARTTWTLSQTPADHRVALVVTDGKGGCATAGAIVSTDPRGLLFAGRVVGTDGRSLEAAEVEVNGEAIRTDKRGLASLRVKDAERFVVNVRSPGYAFSSQVYDNSVRGGLWTLTRASVQRVDPARPIELRNKRVPSDCPGLQRRGAPPRECGPGIKVTIPADAFLDQDGRPPTGPVEVSLATVDLASGNQLPGDYTVLMPDGTTQVMQSYGAGFVEVTSGSRRFNLKKGQQAEVEIPVDPTQLAAGGPLPKEIPLLFYDERRGVWIQEGTAALKGQAYVGAVTHFSAINMDLVKVNQSCLTVDSPTLPAAYRMRVTVPMPPAAPKVKVSPIDNLTATLHVVYNLPSNTTITLEGLDSAANLYIAKTTASSGPPQVPSKPNRPPYPYAACQGHATLTLDTVAPTISVPPADITVEAAGPTGAVVTYAVTVSDDVDPSPTWSCTPASDTTFPVADTTVTCSATDDRGNSATDTFHVIVQDTTAPVLTLPSPAPKEATGELTPVNWGAGLSAADIVDGSCAWNSAYATYCSGSGTPAGTCIVSCDDASGSLYPVGTQTVHCCAKDTHQNKSIGQFNITIQDTTGPVVTPPAAPAPVPQSGACTTVIFDDTATADDLVDGTWTFTCSPASGACFPVGSTYVDCSTDDSHGNSSGPAGFNVVVY